MKPTTATTSTYLPANYLKAPSHGEFSSPSKLPHFKQKALLYKEDLCSSAPILQHESKKPFFDPLWSHGEYQLSIGEVTEHGLSMDEALKHNERTSLQANYAVPLTSLLSSVHENDGSTLCLSLDKDPHKAHNLQENRSWEMLNIEDASSPLAWNGGMPSFDNLFYAVQKCRKDGVLLNAKSLHVCICNCGMETHVLLGNSLVSMFVDCQSITDAHRLFHKLNIHNEYSWTSLMLGYIECGDLHYCLQLYLEMQEEHVHPSKYTFTVLLKACARLNDMERGEELHSQITKMGIQKDTSVCNALVDMYCRCGLIMKAQEAFNEMPNRDVVSWTALMGGYVDHGHNEEALQSLGQMQLEGVSPDAIALCCALSACGNMLATEKGQEIHAYIVKKGLDKDSFVSNNLVDMYAKCGSLLEVEEMFSALTNRDIVTWNSVIAGYVEHGCAEAALDCYAAMQQQMIVPDAVTLICCLKACGSMVALDTGQALHTESVTKGLERELFVGNSLVNMYAKCGCLVEARDTLDNLSSRDEVSWTALIAGYAEHGPWEEALVCLDLLQSEGLSPDGTMFACSLRACGSLKSADRGREIHSEVCKRGFQKDDFVGMALMDFYTKCASPLDASAVFDAIPVRDVVLWNSLIEGYAEQGLKQELLKSLEEMQLSGLSPNAVTYILCLKGCAISGAIDIGQALHTEIVYKGFENEPFVGNSLVDMYSKSGSLTEAQAVFNKLAVQDVVSWTSLFAGYADSWYGEEAQDCFEVMQLSSVTPDVVSWNALISLYAEQDENEIPLLFIFQMQEQGLLPNSSTFASILKFCAEIGALDFGKKTHAQFYSQADDVNFTTALLDMYSKCGSMADAHKVFEVMNRRDLVTWNVLISGHARQGECELVLQLFERMMEEGVEPDEVSHLSVLSVCSHEGLLSKGLKYFEDMVREFAVTPTLKHLSCLVDLYSRLGLLKEAMLIVERMPAQPDLVLWNTMLGACQKWGDLELGRQAFEYAVSMDKEDAAAFVSMSNMYVDDVHIFF